MIQAPRRVALWRNSALLLALLSSLGVFFALSVPYLYLKASAN